MKKATLPVLALFAVLMGLCSCQSTTPTAGDMDRYYKESEAQAERQIAHYSQMRDQGQLTTEEYDRKVEVARAGIGKHAADIAWTRHEMAEAVMRNLAIPTGGHPVEITPPGIGSGDSFYRPAGSEGPGYQGQGSGMWHGYQPGSTVDVLNGMRGY